TDSKYSNWPPETLSRIRPLTEDASRPVLANSLLAGVRVGQPFDTMQYQVLSSVSLEETKEAQARSWFAKLPVSPPENVYLWWAGEKAVVVSDWQTFMD